jgi:glycerol kinase
MSRLIGVIDAGTNSIRFVIFKTSNFAQEQKELCSHEIEIKQISLKEGWLEHNPVEIINAVRECAKIVIHSLPNYGFSKDDISCIGITNQRETVVVWDKNTGKPLYNAIGE